MGPQGPTIGNSQLIRQNDFSFTQIKLVYCLTRKTLKYNSLVQKICFFLQNETSHWKNNLALGPQGPKQYIFEDHCYSKNAKKLRFHVFPLFHVWKHMTSSFYLKWTEFKKIVDFVPIVGPHGPKLNWNKFIISCKYNPLQVKWWYHMFSSIKMEEYMESELFGFFWVKMVAKNIVLGSPGTHFMHMRVIVQVNHKY